MASGRVNPQFQLGDQGINDLGNVYYNLIEPALMQQALVREMIEELGIRVTPKGYVWQSRSIRGIELNWWRAEIVEGEIIKPNPAEVESFQWMTKEQMLELFKSVTF